VLTFLGAPGWEASFERLRSRLHSERATLIERSHGDVHHTPCAMDCTQQIKDAWDNARNGGRPFVAPIIRELILKQAPDVTKEIGLHCEGTPGNFIRSLSDSMNDVTGILIRASTPEFRS